MKTSVRRTAPEKPLAAADLEDLETVQLFSLISMSAKITVVLAYVNTTLQIVLHRLTHNDKVQQNDTLSHQQYRHDELDCHENLHLIQ
jgi:hypothetical protein